MRAINLDDEIVVLEPEPEHDPDPMTAPAPQPAPYTPPPTPVMHISTAAPVIHMGTSYVSSNGSNFSPDSSYGYIQIMPVATYSVLTCQAVSPNGHPCDCIDGHPGCHEANSSLGMETWF